jgi:uroporphyrin-III C-methyltransferase / precorrin-2 dehydrogenase / sirohydrochlorin ferrochelatase
MGGARAIQRGKVWLVGAGPGNPELLTVRAYRLLQNASVVAYDELVSGEVLAIAPASAERIPVGRRASGNRHHDARIHPDVIARALQGKDVIRLKGGDPLVFGRGGEEAEELAREGVAFEFVPGVTAALAAAAAMNIALTHRDCASRVTLTTGHAAGESTSLMRGIDPEGTLVFYMALGRVEETCEGLVANGRSAGTPAAVVSRASLPDARVVAGTLGDLGALVRRAALEPPAILIVGDVVGRRVTSPLQGPLAERTASP